MKTKYLHVEFSDGSEWDIPARIVAENMSAFYKTRDPEERGKVDHCLANEDLADWATGDMNWTDLAAHAVQVKPPTPADYEDAWGSAEVTEVLK